MTIYNVTNLSGIQINVTFDSSRLNYINTTEGEFLSENGSASTYFNESEIDTSTPGLLKDIIVLRQGEPDGVTGQGVLVSIYFNATATGTAYVNVSGGLLSSNEATSISYDTGNSSFTIGSGPDIISPVVTLNQPADTFNTTSQSIVFNATATDNINLTNMTLYTNFTGSWAANVTNSSLVNNTLTNFTVTGISEGIYVWNVYACDNSSNCAYSASNRTDRKSTRLNSSHGY